MSEINLYECQIHRPADFPPGCVLCDYLDLKERYEAMSKSYQKLTEASGSSKLLASKSYEPEDILNEKIKNLMQDLERQQKKIEALRAALILLASET